MYSCLGKELPHEYWVTSASETKSLPSRFKCWRFGMRRISGRKWEMLLYWRSSMRSLVNSTLSIDFNDFIALDLRLSVTIMFAMRCIPEGVLFSPLCLKWRCLIFPKWVKVCAFSKDSNSMARTDIKVIKECPICCEGGNWYNWVDSRLSICNTKSPLKAAGWTYLIGLPVQKNDWNGGW